MAQTPGLLHVVDRGGLHRQGRGFHESGMEHSERQYRVS